MSGVRKHKVGLHEMPIHDKAQPTSAGSVPQYAICLPDPWGMRYSEADPKRKGDLMYPVARDYAKALHDVLINQVQWGAAYFGPPSSEPKLKLQWPIDKDASRQLTDLVTPVVQAALTYPSAGFGIPDSVVPVNMGVKPPDPNRPGLQGVFSPNTWSLLLSAEQLAPLFHIETVGAAESGNRYEQMGPLRVFADTLYHEARHCQQWFWAFAMVQQYPDNFPTLPNIGQWPEALSGGTPESNAISPEPDQAYAVIKLAAQQMIPAEPTALASFKRMALGLYVYTLNLWRHAPNGYRPPYLLDAAALEDEFQRARALAVHLLQNVGIGGTPIDIDAMVAEPVRCYCDYTERPWENDAFACGEMAAAYWDAELGLALKTYTAGQCSHAYELADRARQLESRMSGTGAAKPEGGH
ncbi:hypothetical protein [Ralstonia sp. UBA689]|uniref:hypothetical protein n=1 Tax=Ralstonia sp. UBA689 TaxID=1947373 RepID=UPI0025EEB999|nr:hypothetical protein [Ralstonia sp. UBA689]